MLDSDWTEFKKARNKSQNLKQKIKADTIKKLVAESDNHSKTCWRIFNDEVGRTKRDSSLPTLVVNGQEIRDDFDKLNVLCKSFIKEKPIDVHPYHFEEASKKLLDVRMTKDDVERVINELNVNKPTGVDGIPPIVFKICAESLIPPLTYLFNQFLEHSEYPEELKQAAVFPLYKGKGSKTDPKSYRPISILCSTTKIFESCIYQKVMPFVENEQKINSLQHGYRRNRSTQSAVLKLTNDVRNAGDKREMVGAVFVDFSSAFDNLIYSRLLMKLEAVGITGNLNKWFSAYFTNRTHVSKKRQN